MKISRVLVCSALAIGLSGCLLDSFKSSSAQAPAPVVVNVNKSQAANANTFHLYVGAAQQSTAKTSKKAKQSTSKQDVVVKVGDVSYHTSGSIVENVDVRNAFVAKTVAGDPALGIRLSDAANKRLVSALAVNKNSVVLASLNNSVFSQVNNAGAKLQDGVLLLPMHSLDEARDVANLLRKKK